jgi:hypothetical protein
VVDHSLSELHIKLKGYINDNQYAKILYNKHLIIQNRSLNQTKINIKVLDIHYNKY